MVVYYKSVNNLFMVLGAIAGGLLGAASVDFRILGNHENHAAFFIFALGIFLGIVVGRMVGAIYASRKLRKVMGMLYTECDPDAFLAEFEAMNAKISKELAEYYNGQNAISFAKEAKGDLNGAVEAVIALNAENLKLHALTTTALITNQKTNLMILTRDFPAAENYLADLKRLKEVSEKRAKILAQNLEQQIHLHTARVAAAKGAADADTAYLEEEIRLSTNLIHKKEMQVELAEYFLRTGNREEAEKLLKQVLEDRRGFGTEQRAESLLADPDSVFIYREVTPEEEQEEAAEEAAASLA